jgi:hypothetical protein
MRFRKPVLLAHAIALPPIILCSVDLLWNGMSEEIVYLFLTFGMQQWPQET